MRKNLFFSISVFLISRLVNVCACMCVYACARLHAAKRYMISRRTIFSYVGGFLSLGILRTRTYTSFFGTEAMSQFQFSVRIFFASRACENVVDTFQRIYVYGNHQPFFVHYSSNVAVNLSHSVRCLFVLSCTYSVSYLT